MKMKILVAALMLQCAFAFAQKADSDQNIEVTLSKPHKVVDARVKTYIKAGDYVVAFKYSDQDELIIQSFEIENMSQIAIKEHNKLDKKSVFNRISYLNGKLLIFFELWDDDAQLEQLFVQEVNPKTATFVGKPQRLIAVHGKLEGSYNSTGFYSFEKVDKFNFDFNQDSSLFMITYLQKDEDAERKSKENERKISAHIFDNELNEVWSRKDINLGNMNEIAYLHYALGNDKSIYVLVKTFLNGKRKDRDSRKSKKPNYNLRLFRLTPDGQTIEGDYIDIGERFILSSGIKFVNDKVIFGGYFGTAKTSGTEGVFAYEISNQGKILREVHKEYPLEYIQMYWSERSKKKGKKKEAKDKLAIDNLILDEIIISTDGGLTLIGERDWYETSTTTDANGRTSTTNIYYRGNIYVTRISPEGKANFMTQIPKLQSRYNLGYKNLNFKGDYYFLYSDNKYNLNLRMNDYPRNASVKSKKGGRQFTAAKLNSKTGDVSKQTLFNLDEVKGVRCYQFNYNRVVQISDTEIAIEVYKKKKEDIWIIVKVK